MLTVLLSLSLSSSPPSSSPLPPPPSLLFSLLCPWLHGRILFHVSICVTTCMPSSPLSVHSWVEFYLHLYNYLREVHLREMLAIVSSSKWWFFVYSFLWWLGWHYRHLICIKCVIGNDNDWLILGSFVVYSGRLYFWDSNCDKNILMWPF